MITSAKESLSDWKDRLWRYPVRCGLVLLLAFAVGAFVLSPTFAFIAESSPPVIVSKTKLSDLASGSGGTLRLLIDKPVSSPCDGTIRRMLYRWNTDFGSRIPEFYPLQYDGKGDPLFGSRKFILDLPITARLLEKDWIYAGVFYPHCSILAFWKKRIFGEQRRMVSGISAVSAALPAGASQ